MYKLDTYEEQGFKMYRLSNPDDTSWITVCPERGGIITAFGVNKEEQLYLNKETLWDSTKNIRGGIPILFPISGQLDKGQYEWEKTTYKMPNHGLARIHPWEVIASQVSDDHASLSIKLVSTPITLDAYPFHFEVTFTYILKGNELLIEQAYQNLSDSAMPMYPGFHPYFLSDRKTIQIQSDATQFYDYNDHRLKEFTGKIDMENKVEAVALLDAKDNRIVARMDEKKQIIMEAASEFKYTMIWTEKDKPFICVEPWVAKTDEMNRKEELLIIEPTHTLVSRLSIKIEYSG